MDYYWMIIIVFWVFWLIYMFKDQIDNIFKKGGKRMREDEYGRQFPAWAKWLIGIIVVIFAIALLNPIAIIGPGEVGVVYSAIGGIDLDRIMEPGWNFRIPILQRIYHVKTARATINMYGTFEECQSDKECDDIALHVLTNEGLEVGIDVTVFYRVKPDESPSVVQELTMQYQEGTVMPRIRGIVRDVIGDMAITEVYGPERERLAQEIFDSLEPLMVNDGFVLDEVQVRDIDPPKEISDAIKAKQKMEQDVMTKEHEVRLAAKEAERKITEAGGIAKSIEIQGETLRKNPEYLQLKQLDVTLALYQNPNTRFVIVPPGTYPILPTEQIMSQPPVVEE